MRPARAWARWSTRCAAGCAALWLGLGGAGARADEAGAGGAAVGSAAPAEQGAAPAAESPRRYRDYMEGIEEITVTARRRGERLQTTPISIAAFGEDELEARQITQITDLGQAVANLQLDVGNGSTNQTRVYIRGVGQDDFRSNVDPGVGLYVDGVYLTRLTGSLISTLDVESVEVLRGPQGTLFGRNTIGGVVSVRTRRPGSELEATARARIGNLGRFETAATLNLPLIPEMLLSRLSVETQTDDGYTRNRTTQSRSGDNKLLKGRYQLRLLPTDTLALDLSYERTREDEKQPTPECRLGNPFAPGRLLTDSLARGSEGDFVTACLLDRSDGEELTAGADFDQKNDLDTQFLIGTVEWDLGPASLRSISSWRRVDIRASSFDLDATSTDGFGLRSARDQNDAFSQELLLFGRVGRLQYTAGLYGSREKGHATQDVSALTQAVAAIRDGRPLFFAGVPSPFSPGQDLSVDDANRLATLAGISGSPTFFTDSIFSLNPVVTSRFENLSYAGFAELTYDLTDRISLTGGVRYTRERKERQGKTIPVPDSTNTALDENGDGVADPIAGRPIADRFGKWTGRVQLGLQPTDSVFAYLSYSRGFKSGGFNRDLDDPDNPNDDDPGRFGQETIDSYEVGAKTRWLDDRLVLNLSAFFNEYENIQLTTLQINSRGNPVVQINNVAEATIKGLELDFQLRPWIDGLTFFGGVGVTDADYRDFFAREDAATKLLRNEDDPPIDFERCRGLNGPVCPNLADFANAALRSLRPGPLRVADFSDLDRSNTPNFNASVSVDYVLDLDRFGLLRTRLSYFTQGDVEYTTFNDEDVRQSRFGLVSGRIAWDLWDGNTTIALYGRNLLDRRYVVGGFDFDDTNGVKTVFYGRPRTFGVEILRRFE